MITLRYLKRQFIIKCTKGDKSKTKIHAHNIYSSQLSLHIKKTAVIDIV